MTIILISNTNEPTSGWGTLTHNHALTLHRHDVPFVLLLPKNAKRLSVPYNDKIKYILPDLPLSFNGLGGILSLPRLWPKINLESREPTVVHSLVDFPYAVLAWRIARKYKLPFILSALGTYSVRPFTNFIDRHLFLPVYRNADLIIAISHFTAQRMEAAAGESRKNKIITINLPSTPQ